MKYYSWIHGVYSLLELICKAESLIVQCHLIMVEEKKKEKINSNIN